MCISNKYTLCKSNIVVPAHVNSTTLLKESKQAQKSIYKANIVSIAQVDEKTIKKPPNILNKAQLKTEKEQVRIFSMQKE